MRRHYSLFRLTHVFAIFFADIAMDWSDHAMWWPDKNIWLDKTRWTLDQYNITADAVIHFTPMHKTLRIQLPDLRYIDCNVDFSIKTFNASVNLCKEMGKTCKVCTLQNATAGKGGYAYHYANLHAFR